MNLLLLAVASLLVVTSVGQTDEGPRFLNQQWDVRAGERFVLYFYGCKTADGCTITLITGGDILSIEPVANLVEGTRGESYSLLLDDAVASGKYAFEIARTAANASLPNYSQTFDYHATEASTTTTAASYAPTPTEVVVPPPTPSRHRLSSGVIAGIVVGCVAAITLISGAVFMFYRRRRRNASQADSSKEEDSSQATAAKDPESGASSPSDSDTPASPWGFTGNFGKAELDADETTQSPQTPLPPQLPAELDAVETTRHELEEKSTSKHELDAEFTSKYEIDESPRKYSWESTGRNI